MWSVPCYNRVMSTIHEETVPVALTIAGSDSGGGAGIQADLRSFRAFGVHGCTAITALTAQNPHHVTGIQATTADILRQQLACIAEDFAVAAVKTGMLFNAELIHVVGEFRDSFGQAPWVIDPVMVATSGSRLLAPEAETALMEKVIPHATLITPNLPEAAVLLGDATLPQSPEEMVAIATRLQARYGVAALVKGGHLSERSAMDVLCDHEGKCYRIETPTIPNPPTTHGTGCALSSAIAANLALGRNVMEAILQAKAYLMDLLAAGASAGRAAVYGPEGADYDTDLVACTRL